MVFLRLTSKSSRPTVAKVSQGKVKRHGVGSEVLSKGVEGAGMRISICVIRCPSLWYFIY